MGDIITDAINQVLRTRHALIEQACEVAIQGGKDGVVVIESPDLFNPTMFYVAVRPEVPYGHLFTFPSMDAFEHWIGNGMPQ